VLQLPEGMAHLNQDQKLSSYRAIRIPDTIEDLTKYDFNHNSYLKIVELPKKIKAISLNTFRHHDLERFVFGSKISHFDKIVLSSLFIKDFVVYEDVTTLKNTYDGKGMKLNAHYRDIRSLVASNRHLELNLISTYENIQILIKKNYEALLVLADESNALQSKIVLIDVVSQKQGQDFNL
jgi:hypothetical protein